MKFDKKQGVKWDFGTKAMMDRSQVIQERDQAVSDSGDILDHQLVLPWFKCYSH